MLELSGVSVDYGNVRAVRDLDLAVREGEIVSLVGANGAGKSTTLRAVFGLARPSTGHITANGADITKKAPEMRVPLGLALVPEGRRIFGKLTVAENLRLGSLVIPDGDRRRAAIERGLELFPKLRSLYQTPASKLSGGEQQMVAIARALASEPRLLALDEPSLGLSPTMTDLVFEALENLSSDGTTILLIEQNAARAAALADRTYVLRNGRLAAQLKRDEIGDLAAFAEAYLGA